MTMDKKNKHERQSAEYKKKNMHTQIDERIWGESIDSV